jgi:hypothetical protein
MPGEGLLHGCNSAAGNKAMCGQPYHHVAAARQHTACHGSVVAKRSKVSVPGCCYQARHTVVQGKGVAALQTAWHAVLCCAVTLRRTSWRSSSRIMRPR